MAVNSLNAAELELAAVAAADRLLDAAAAVDADDDDVPAPVAAAAAALCLPTAERLLLLAQEPVASAGLLL